MKHHSVSKKENLLREQRLNLLFFHMNNTKSDSFIAYCIKLALEKHDYENVLIMLKNLYHDDGAIIYTIYGESVVQLINTL